MTKPKSSKKGKNRAVPLADEGQEYARVVALLGNNRVRAKFVDGTERVCLIRGSMRRREWVHVGDIVLVALRDLAGDKADIVFAYLPAEVQRLRRMGQLVDIVEDEEDREMHDVVGFEEAVGAESEGECIDWERM